MNRDTPRWTTRRCDRCGSEIARDYLDRDSSGPRYHGGDWDLAEREDDFRHGDENVDDDGEVSGERGDDRLRDPGTRGAVFGRGGLGLVERDTDLRHYAQGRWEHDARDPDYPRRKRAPSRR